MKNRHATKTEDNPEKANNTKYSRTKLAWFSRLIQYWARKQSGLILQCSQAHTGNPKAWTQPLLTLNFWQGGRYPLQINPQREVFTIL